MSKAKTSRTKSPRLAPTQIVNELGAYLSSENYEEDLDILIEWVSLRRSAKKSPNFERLKSRRQRVAAKTFYLGRQAALLSALMGFYGSRYAGPIGMKLGIGFGVFSFASAIAGLAFRRRASRYRTQSTALERLSTSSSARP
jgi:hypothetical protein